MPDITVAEGKWVVGHMSNAGAASREIRLSGRAWALVTIGGVLVLLALAVLPVGSLERSVVARIAGLISAAVFMVAALRLRPGSRAIWWCMWGFVLLTAVTDVAYDIQASTPGEVPSPGITDVLYLSTYAFAFAGLVRLERLRAPRRDLEGWIDSAIILTAAVSLGGVFIIEPLLAQSGSLDGATMVSIAYPVCDLLLVAALVRNALGPGGSSPSLVLLMMAMVLFLVADIIYNVIQGIATPDSDPAVLEVLWTAALMCIALAVLAPGAGTLGVPPAEGVGEPGQIRLVALGFAVLTTPVLLCAALLVGLTTLATWLSAVTILVVVLLLWRISVMVRVMSRQAQRQRALASLDSLTGLPNRRAWDSETDHLVRRSRAQGLPTTIAILDLDHFKEFNDSQGHQAGDRVLAAAADAWRRQLRRTDLLARYGGEEFGLLLPGVSVAEAVTTLERLREVMPYEQTVSIGAAQVRPGEDPIDALRRADVALYRAKAEGRDCVRIDTHQPPRADPVVHSTSEVGTAGADSDASSA
ncbi:MAG: hypothetical protein QG597_2405 [Actinomycetota bacterium]|nr:hypothetical protein [Actinomycetota bacterium]